MSKVKKNEPHYNGPDYVPEFDYARLSKQTKRVFDVMLCANKRKEWLTLRELEERSETPQASASAQLRHLRKDRFGKHSILKRRRGNREAGLFEYYMIPNLNKACEQLSLFKEC